MLSGYWVVLESCKKDLVKVWVSFRRFCFCENLFFFLIGMQYEERVGLLGRGAGRPTFAKTQLFTNLKRFAIKRK